jgi:hypothetical protein
VAYGAVGLCTMLIVGADDGGGGIPKWPRAFGD